MTLNHCLRPTAFSASPANSVSVKPRPHQQQCRSNIVECYESNDFFDKVERCFDIVDVFGNNVERNFVISTKSKRIEHVQFDFVERTKFRSTLLSKTATMSKQHPTLSKRRNFTINSFDIVAVFWQQIRMLLRQSRTLLRHVAGVDGALAYLILPGLWSSHSAKCKQDELVGIVRS